MMTRTIAYLATDAYGGRGGIALYNRDMIEALIGDPANGCVDVLPRIAGNGVDPIPTAVHWHAAASGGAKAFIGEALKLAIKRRGSLDLIYCGHINLLPVARMIKLITGAPILLAIYGIEAWDPPGSRLSRWSLAGVDHVLSISRFTAELFVRWSGFALDEIFIVPNAIRLEPYGPGPKRVDLLERFGLAGRQVITLCGRMDAGEGRKGFDELIEAFPAIRSARPDAALMLMGDGSDQQRLQDKVAAMGLAEHVVFTGFVPEAEKADYYRLSDAYVMPSLQEGFGFVHLEAMACGVPAVASDKDGAREAVREGLIGELCDPKDRQSIVDATLVALDKGHGVPAGLDYFAFPHFAERACACIATATSSR